MRPKFIIALLIVSSVIFLCLFIGLAHTNEGFHGMASFAISFLASTPGATATATTPSPSGSGSSLDPAIVAALIGIAVAFVAGGFAVFQTLYSAKVQRKSAEAQRRHDLEVERLRRELDEQYKAKEQEEQQKAATLEAARREMLLAQILPSEPEPTARHSTLILAFLVCKFWI